jgi:putative ABC transport system permease protein
MGEMWRRVGMLMRREKFARELEEEIRLHREMKEQELSDEGASAEEARCAANRAFGNARRMRERSEEAWGWRWLMEFAQDARYGARTLRKSPGFTAVAVVTLALGIGANTAIFSLVYGALLRPLPFANAKQIVLLQGSTRQTPRTPASYADMEDWQRQSQSFNGISAWAGQSINLTGVEKPERVRGAFVSSNFFELLGVRAEHGRTFLPGEDEPGSARVAVVNHSLWVRRFGADREFLGKKLVLNGSVFTVAGILPEGFDFPLDPDRNEIWLPFQTNPYFSRSRDHYNLYGIAKLKDGVTLEAARAEMATIASRLAEQYPDEDGQRSVAVWPLREVVTEDRRTLLLVLFGAAGLVLLIACANVANLLLARGAARKAELSLRAALGATGTRIARQMLSETFVLWATAGALGLAMAVGGLRVVSATSAVTLRPGSSAEIDGNVLLFAVLLTAATAVVAGLAPALRYSQVDVEAGLKEGGRGAGESKRAGRLRHLLLVGQVGMSLVLLGGAGLMMRTMANLAGVKPGFDPKNLLTLEYRLPQTEYPHSSGQWNFHQRVVEGVRRIPGVRSASVAMGIPFTENIGLEPILLLDRAAPPPGQEPLAQHNFVDARYFETLGIPLLAGRGIRESDGPDAPRVVVINETMARQFWRDGDAVGRRMQLLDEKKPATIVGVVGDVKQDRIDEKPQPQIYVAYAQNPMGFATLVVRTEGDPMSFASTVRDAVWAVDRNQPVWKVRSMEGLMRRDVSDRRSLAFLLGAYASLATFLAAVGTYGVLSYAVSRRMREFSIRMALGASASETLRLVIGQGMTYVGIGILAGLAGSFGLSRSLAGLLYGVKANDPANLTIGAAALGVAGLLACWLPARRASRVDPMRILRTE